MAGGAPIYRQQLDVPAAPSATVQPIAAPVPDTSAVFGAAAGLADKAVAFAQKQYQGDQETKASTARAEYLTGLQTLQDEYSQSDDYSNAPQEFQQKRYRLASDAMSGIQDPKVLADLQLHMTVAGLSAQGKVNAAALKRQVDAGVAGLDSSVDDLQQRAAGAGSPRERQELVGTAFQSIDNAASAGNIDATAAVSRKRLFLHGLSTADVARSIAANPAAAITSLDDPNNYPALTPFERETLKAQAVAAHDERTRLMADDLAKRDPATAAARYGTVTTRAIADQIYSRVIIPQESSGKADAISPVGAVGLGQVMPATARDQAKKLGIKDLDGKSDVEVTELLKNPDLNVRLGGSLWRDNLQRYGGNVWAAAAAYNAGAGSADKPRADAWDKAARAQFGDHYSPAQLASVIPIKETRDYVLSVAQRLGVDAGAPPLSFRGSYGVAAAVTQQLAHQANEQQRQDNALISLQSDDRSAMVTAFRQGYETNPQEIQTLKQPLIDAAARGNTDAAVKLRQFEDAQSTYPLVQEAYKHTPEQVEGAVAALRAKIEKDGGTAQDLRRLDVLDKVSSTMADARKNNPVGLLERQLGPQSVTSIQPPQSPTDPQFATVLSLRNVTATSANATYGGDFKFFKPQEAAALKPWFAGLPAEGQAAALSTISGYTTGGAREAAFREITDGKPVTMYAAGLFAQSPDIAASILRGASGVDQYVPSSGAAKQSYDTQRATALPPAIFTTAGRLDENGPYAAMSAAIDARYAYLSAQANDASKNLSASRLKQAADDVTGGVLYHNGSPLVAPVRGMGQRELDGIVYGLTDKDMTGAQTSGGQKITADYLRSSAKLRSRADGVYYVQINQDDARPQYAVTEAGTPFVLDLRNRKTAPRPAPEPLEATALP